jgi:hypothetical protein
MQEGHGEFENVDFVVAIDVLEDRTGVDEARRDRLEVLHAVAIGAHDVHRAFGLGEAERHRQTVRRRGHARQDAEALRIARDVVEQNRRRVFRSRVIDHLGDGADFEVPIGPVDLLQLAQGVGASQPLAQVLVGSVVFRLLGRLHVRVFRLCHCVSLLFEERVTERGLRLSLPPKPPMTVEVCLPDVASRAIARHWYGKYGL